ncbi:hypothetical protein C1645_781244 [Glomus cerebriforme]|uniref:Uncharacterized protein n=1 Tax=Glomus cerebriforme TaxID=658196 RepID=A0A397SHH7_9GLOM|nr:hypothetical protein C1645_781244 [Glomus cerebriforme]
MYCYYYFVSPKYNRVQQYKNKALLRVSSQFFCHVLFFYSKIFFTIYNMSVDVTRQ